MGRHVFAALPQRLLAAALLLTVLLGASVRDSVAANPSYLSRWGSAGIGDGQFTSAVSISHGIDPSWQAVLDRDAGRVQLFAGAGSFLASYTAGLLQPEGVTTDNAKQIYITDTGHNRVVVITPNYPGAPYPPSSFGSTGSSPGMFLQPCGITCANGYVYVVDRGNHRVQVFQVSVSGTGVVTPIYFGSWGSQGNTDGKFESPTDIVEDPSGNIWVVDTGNNRIQKFSSAGVHLLTLGGPGSGPVQFNNPRGIAIDSQGIVYVADTGNHRVQALRPGGGFITFWGGAGDGDYQFDEPFDVSVEYGGPESARIQVVDRTNHNIKYYDDIRFPSAANSTTEPWLELLAGNGVVLDPPGRTFTVTVRDELNNPMPSVTVTLDLSACADLALAAVQPDPALTISCEASTASLVTDATGQASFRLAGHVQYRSLGSSGEVASVLAGSGAESVLLSTARVAAMDQDGMNGIDDQDRYFWLVDLGLGTYYPRSDYDGDGLVGLNDLSLFQTRLAGGGSSVSSTRCDGGPTIRPVRDPGSSLKLAWNDCSAEDGGAGVATSTFACNTNSGSRNLFATITTPLDVSDVTAFDALVEIKSAPGTQLPPWWDFSAGGCRLISSFGTSGDGYLGTCSAGGGVFSTAAEISQPANGSNREVVHVSGVASSGGVTIIGEQPSTIFRMSVNNQRTAGVGSCAGCSEPVVITLLSVRLIRGGDCGTQPCDLTDFDLVSNGGNMVGWQAGLSYLIKSYPSTVVSNGTKRLHVQGKYIAAGSTIRLFKSGESPVVGSAVVVDAAGAWIDADFDMSGAATGRWSIEVKNPAGSPRELSPAVTVETPNVGDLQPLVRGESVFRSGRTGAWSVGGRHTGNTPWQGLSFGALYLNGGVGPVTLTYSGLALSSVTPPAGPANIVGVYSLPVIGVGADALPVVASITPPIGFGCGTLEWELFEVSANTEPLAPARVVLQLVHDRGVAQGLSWSAASPAFQSALELQLKSELETRQAALTASPAANLSLSEHAELVRTSLEGALLTLSGAYSTDVAAYRSTWDVLRAGAPWDAFRANMLVTYRAMAAPVAPLDLFPCTPLLLDYCFIASCDPNDKTGPSGAGAQHAIAAGTGLDYRVRFENKPEATAAAQDVIVLDTLDTAALDPATFEFTEFTFGSHVVTPPSGTASYTGDVDLRPDVELIVRITGELDPSTGVVRVAFRSLDPATMEPTLDPVLGFLPPNVTSPEGEGSVSFMVQHQPGLPDATLIQNRARIVFDLNPPIDTPLWSNVLDLSPPTSQVSPLGAAQGGASFNVSWAGADAGAGLFDYSIWVSTDAGPYALWLKNTTATSASFAGSNGHAYAFYSTSRDGAGLIEAPPATADATTAVTLGVGVNSEHLALAILPIRPSPVVGALNVEFTLPVEGDGALELFDIGGRCVVSRPLGGMAAGVHHETLLNAGARPGVYFLRLQQAGRSVHQRVVITN